MKHKNHSGRFTLLVVRGDGARVLRLRFPRRLPILILAGVGLFVVALGVLASDWWLNRARMREAIDAQRAAIAGLKGRMAEVQTEVASWRELHARIWEPFGPDAAAKGRRTGVGGPSVTLGQLAKNRIASSDEGDRLADAVREEGENLRALERLISRAGKTLGSVPSRWPVRGVVNSEFGGRQSVWAKGGEFHGGIDIAAERGTPVQAPAAGMVTFAGGHAEYGLTVMVDHGDGLRTIYGHLSRITVTPGQKVARGAELGLTGNTGRSSGPHLHYEILVKDHPVNPRAYFWD